MDEHQDHIFSLKSIGLTGFEKNARVTRTFETDAVSPRRNLLLGIRYIPTHSGENGLECEKF